MQSSEVFFNSRVIEAVLRGKKTKKRFGKIFSFPSSRRKKTLVRVVAVVGRRRWRWRRRRSGRRRRGAAVSWYVLRAPRRTVGNRLSGEKPPAVRATETTARSQCSNGQRTEKVVLRAVVLFAPSLRYYIFEKTVGRLKTLPTRLLLLFFLLPSSVNDCVTLFFFFIAVTRFMRKNIHAYVYK